MTSTKKRMEIIRERRSFAFSGSRAGRLHALRVFLLVIALAGLVWYGKLGNNPFAVTRIVRVFGDAGRGDVDFIVVTGAGAGTATDTARADVARKEAYPFGGVRAVLSEFAGTMILVCDSSIFAFADSGAKPLFHERLDLLIIPAAAEETANALRDRFRPRFLTVLPPCSFPSAQNIICLPADANGEFTREFTVRRGKLVR